MKLVNETDQQVSYSISASALKDSGTIDVNGLVDLPAYDNQTEVTVAFAPTNKYFITTAKNTHSGQMVQMAVKVAIGKVANPSGENTQCY